MTKSAQPITHLILAESATYLTRSSVSAAKAHSRELGTLSEAGQDDSVQENTGGG